MTDVISTRLDEKDVEELNKISDKEHIDRSALIRRFLLEKMKEYRMKEVAEKFRKGIISLAEGASLANVSIYEMMEYLDRERIKPPSLTHEQMEEEWQESKRIFENLKKED
jgi:predicted HTH domain antitoxin